MRPTQKAKKALSSPKMIYNKSYWDKVKNDIYKDLDELIREKARQATKPHKSDLLAMDEKDAQRILYWSNKNALEVNTLYIIRLYMDTLMEVSLVSLMEANKEYNKKLNRLGAEVDFWKQSTIALNESSIVSSGVAIQALELLHQTKNATL